MKNPAALSVLATQTAVWQKLRHVPTQTWLNLGLCVLAVAVILRLWKTLKKFNDYAPWIASVLAGVMIMSYWTYNRTEPRFLTPAVDKLMLFLPTKAKHQQDLDQLRKSRED